MNSADYDVGFETGKEESRIIFENTVLPQRVKQAISANNKKWVDKIGNMFGELEDCLTPAYPNPDTGEIEYYILSKDDLQQLKKDMEAEG